jgi:hypothetical protein
MLSTACLLGLLLAPHNELRAVPVSPGNPIRYAEMAFNPAAWEQRKLDPLMIPWVGGSVVFLTRRGDYDERLMSRWVGRLDDGWQLFTELTGRSPKLHKQLQGKPTIAAVPDSNVTCGVGCGFIGATGIELAKFYTVDLPAFAADPGTMPHYVFYEMGRNFYTFGHRHSCFITGFAVFMRYVCMDTLNCRDTDGETRQKIQQMEEYHSKGTLGFLDCFTDTPDFPEKKPRISAGDGKWRNPSDQPVMYASAMLRLYRECGGNVWLKRFFSELSKCPEVKADTREGALEQCWHWYLCASVAAGKNLAPVFCDAWRLPLAEVSRGELGKIAWDASNLSAVDLARRVRPVWKF